MIIYIFLIFVKSGMMSLISGRYGTVQLPAEIMAKISQCDEVKIYMFLFLKQFKFFKNFFYAVE